MSFTVPRLIVAGTNSGCGKSTVTAALLQAFTRRKAKVSAFKCGPDYLDPMLHSRITGGDAYNLDPYFFSEGTLKYLLAKHGADRDINVIEGVMGYYDGMGMTSLRASSYELSLLTDSPVLLVVSARASALSVIALIEGFCRYRPDNKIRGVVLNGCSAMAYSALSEEIKRHFHDKILPLGYLPRLPEAELESRRLGLVMDASDQKLDEKLRLLGEEAEKTLALDEISGLAGSAPALDFECPPLPEITEPSRIAVARDEAFCFYYRDNLDLLKEMGAEICFFSPLLDAKLPRDINWLYLGGGFPELYAEALSKNQAMRSSVKAALERGLPCLAEGGGFLYLMEALDQFPMAGVLPGRSYDNGKLTRFGYLRLKALKDNVLCEAGDEIKAHEFHYWESENTGDAFLAEKESGKSWHCIHASDTLFAGFPHLHFYANLSFARHFYERCLKEKHEHGKA